MTQAVFNISENVNQVINIVMTRYNLQNESQAIEKVVLAYGADFLEPELRPEFIKKMQQRQQEPTQKINNFKEHFNLN